MMIDTRLPRAMVDEYLASAAEAQTIGRASPLKLGLARWMVRTGAKLHGDHPVIVDGDVVTLSRAPKPAPDMPRAA